MIEANKKLSTFYITKYALTSGTFKIDLHICITESGNKYASSENNEHWYLIGKDAFENISDAIRDVEKRRDKFIKSAENKIQKLMSSNFTNIIKNL